MAMWTDSSGVLYTDAPQRKETPRHTAPHRAPEPGVDWWLGRTVTRGGQEWFVVAAEDGKLVLENEDERVERVTLLKANEALRTGRWEI